MRRVNSKPVQLTALSASLLSYPSAASVAPDPIAELIDPSRAAEIRPVAEAAAFSSYDRSGGNDDGFSGKYSCLRREKDGCVIAEVKGPGAVTRMFLPEPYPEGPIDFYFDGEKTPRISATVPELLNRPPFVMPLAGHGLGAAWSYVPLGFAKSIKIVVRAPVMHFYMINYVRFEPGTKVRTFDPTAPVVYQLPSLNGEAVKLNAELKGGQSVSLLDRKKTGRIQALRIGPSGSLARMARDLTIRIYWDGSATPAVNVPVGDFFGYSFGQPSAKSLLLGSDDKGGYLLLPMPFARSARVELVSEDRSAPPLPITSEIIVSDQPKASNELYFHALWHRENPTTTGKLYTYLNVKGQGQLVTTILQAQGFEPGNTGWFEGDEIAYIDGKFAFEGDGSESSFNGCWYDVPGRWYGGGSMPFSGSLEYNKPIARTGGFRLEIPDAYTFHRSLHYSIEHGPEGNKLPTDYTSTVFYYLNRAGGDANALPPLAARAVTPPHEFALTFWPSPPPIASILELSPVFKSTKVAGELIFYMELQRPPADDESKGPVEFSDGFGAPSIAFTVTPPQPGDYEIFVDGFTSLDSAKIQLRVGDQIAGKPVDLYGADDNRTGPISLGTAHLSDGANTLFILMPRRNPKSAGTRVRLISLKGNLNRQKVENSIVAIGNVGN